MIKYREDMDVDMYLEYLKVMKKRRLSKEQRKFMEGVHQSNTHQWKKKLKTIHKQIKQSIFSGKGEEIYYEL